MKKRIAQPSPAQMELAQEMVMTGYINRGYLRDDERKFLHMFFSPFRVPRRMTKGEVQMVVLLQKNCPEILGDVNLRKNGYETVMTRLGFLRLINGVLRAMD